MSDCIQKINVSGQAFCSWCHETIRCRPINQHFVDCFFVSSLPHIILIFDCFGTVESPEFVVETVQTRILAEMKIENRGTKYFPWEKIDKHTFFSMKMKMMDL